MTEEISRLILPAHPEYLRFARITGAGLASRLEFSYDELDDLRLAVDELCFALLPAGPPMPAHSPTSADPEGAEREPYLELVFTVTGSSIELEGRICGSHRAPEALSGLAKRILSAIVDAYEVRPSSDNIASIWMRKDGPKATGP